MTGTATTRDATARANRFLDTEGVLWLATVGPSGSPALVPLWFWWDGEAILVASKPDARKVRNIRANPRVMLALGDPDADFDVGLIEAQAELVDLPAHMLLRAGLAAKYAARMAAIGLTTDEFAATYRQVVRIVPTRPLAWQGRTRSGEEPSGRATARPGWLERLLVVLGLRERPAGRGLAAI
jgi:PPOX class probable F420-dependent enzyme